MKANHIKSSSPSFYAPNADGADDLDLLSADREARDVPERSDTRRVELAGLKDMKKLVRIPKPFYELLCRNAARLKKVHVRPDSKYLPFERARALVRGLHLRQEVLLV
jgi:hypothetical protein